MLKQHADFSIAPTEQLVGLGAVHFFSQGGDDEHDELIYQI